MLGVRIFFTAEGAEGAEEEKNRENYGAKY